MLTLNELIYTLSPNQDKIIQKTKQNINDISCHNSLYNRYILSNKFDTRDLYICISEIMGTIFIYIKVILKTHLLNQL